MTKRYLWDPTDVVIAVDPGLMTGYSTWWLDGGFQTELSGQMPWEEFEDWLWHHLLEYAAAGKTVHVQAEKFTISPRTLKTDIQYESLYVNGSIQFMVRKTGASFAFSTPEQVMRLFTNKVLRQLKLSIPGKEHQHDSARHLAFVLLQRKVIGSRDWTKPDPGE